MVTVVVFCEKWGSVTVNEKRRRQFFYVKKLIFWIVWIHKGRYDSWISILCMWWTLSDVKDNKCRIMLTEHKCFSLKNSIHLSLENTVFRLHWSLVYLSLFNIILQHILKKRHFYLWPCELLCYDTYWTAITKIVFIS